jgi:hypothetical protein
MLRRSAERAPSRRTIEDQFDNEFARRLGQVPSRSEENLRTVKSEEDLDKF